MKTIIDKLNEAFLQQNVECDGAVCMGCWKDIVREAIKMLEATSRLNEQDKWVSITDRFPEEGQRCLVAKKEVVLCYFENGKFYIEKQVTLGDRCASTYYTDVKLWRPLPSLPPNPAQ